MTVCIAAAYQIPGDDAPFQGIVLCTDNLASGPLGRSETKLKIRTLKTGWVCLTAGSESEILATLVHLQGEFANAEEITEANATTIVRNALNARKREKSDEYIQGNYGLSYDDFLDFGKEKLPPEHFRESFAAIRRIDIGCEFIIAGFVQPISGGFPFLMETNRKCGVSVSEDFAVIGEGGILASAALLQREQSDVNELNYTLYTVYEAKKNAEHVVSVGEFTSLVVLTPDGKRRRVTMQARNELIEKYKNYGPKEVPYDLSIEANLYDED